MALWRRRATDKRSEIVWRVLPTILYMTIMTAASSVQGRDVPVVIDDRLGHFIEYFIFGVLLLFTAAGFTKEHITTRWFGAALSMGMLYALIDEWHQSFVPGRESSVKDLFFDFMGLSIALILLGLALRPGRHP